MATQTDSGRAEGALPRGPFRYVGRESRRHQPWLCLLAGAVFPLTVVPVELNGLRLLSLLGGVDLVIEGATTIGTVVAFISGFQRLADSSRELFAYYPWQPRPGSSTG